ncbi:hypothetical protein E2C01_040451 [Portunus trituberculatus]|uniref:Uncharacterized protein n=1 Tax=Portunus trituberculatus TaxID=210409 RepID=A0A5B7FMK1_PORTR|nr:hypothetical protein [Portunus trituberculatus]
MTRAFTELTAVHELTNHVNFITHMRGAFLDPVLTDLPADSVQCCQLVRAGSSDYFAVLCEVRLNPANEKGNQCTIWLWEKANWRGLKEELASTNWDVNFTENVNHNVTTLTSLILSAQTRHVILGELLVIGTVWFPKDEIYY